MFKELHIELTKKPRWKRTNERRVKSEAAVSWMNFYYEFYYANSSHRERKTAEENEANCVCPLPISSQFLSCCASQTLSVMCAKTHKREKRRVVKKQTKNE